MVEPASPTSGSAAFEWTAAEFVLLAGGAALTVVVLVVAVLLYRMASREHRAQLEQERREQAGRDARHGGDRRPAP